jgi:hypothetical protein
MASAPAGRTPGEIVAAHGDQINKRFDTLSEGEITPFRSLGEVLTAALNRIAREKGWPLPFPEAGIADEGGCG